MKITKNEKAKKYIVLCIIVAIISTVFMIIITIRQNNIYKNQINEKIALIIGNVEEKYPNISDEEIISILNETQKSDKGQEILEKYGITGEESAILEIEKEQKIYLYLNIGILIISFIIYISIFIIYLKQRKKKIDELDKYIQKVANKDYTINIEESSEDELNSLQNSLYKITVMLKEEAENKRLQNEAILQSVSDISHQIKTPLTSIQILLDNILESKDMDEKTRQNFIMEIEKQIKGMNFLILSLLKLAKLEADVVEFEKNPIDFNKLINDVIKNLEILSDLKQINIETQLSQNISIIGDYNWNKEAIQNIVKNAIEHSNQGGNITIKLEENNVYVSLKIIDEGQGIKKEDLKNIFNRFYKTANSDENSIGIGLALSKSIIEKQNGFITAESQLGKGTTFTIKYLK